MPRAIAVSRKTRGFGGIRRRGTRLRRDSCAGRRLTLSGRAPSSASSTQLASCARPIAARNRTDHPRPTPQNHATRILSECDDSSHSKCPGDSSPGNCRGPKQPAASKWATLLRLKRWRPNIRRTSADRQSSVVRYLPEAHCLFAFSPHNTACARRLATRRASAAFPLEALLDSRARSNELTTSGEKTAAPRACGGWGGGGLGGWGGGCTM